MPKNTGANASNELQTTNVVVQSVVALLKGMIPSGSRIKRYYFEPGFSTDDPVVNCGVSGLVVFLSLAALAYPLSAGIGALLTLSAMVWLLTSTVFHLVFWVVGRVCVFFA